MPHTSCYLLVFSTMPLSAPTPGPVDNPQDAAFLAAFKYAQRNVFMSVLSTSSAIVRVRLTRRGRFGDF